MAKYIINANDGESITEWGEYTDLNEARKEMLKCAHYYMNAEYDNWPNWGQGDFEGYIEILDENFETVEDYCFA